MAAPSFVIVLVMLSTMIIAISSAPTNSRHYRRMWVRG